MPRSWASSKTLKRTAPYALARIRVRRSEEPCCFVVIARSVGPRRRCAREFSGIEKRDRRPRGDALALRGRRVRRELSSPWRLRHWLAVTSAHRLVDAVRAIDTASSAHRRAAARSPHPQGGLGRPDEDTCSMGCAGGVLSRRLAGLPRLPRRRLRPSVAIGHVPYPKQCLFSTRRARRPIAVACFRGRLRTALGCLLREREVLAQQTRSTCMITFVSCGRLGDRLSAFGDGLSQFTAVHQSRWRFPQPALTRCRTGHRRHQRARAPLRRRQPSRAFVTGHKRRGRLPLLRIWHNCERLTELTG